jgi:hypothetical protein
MPMFTYDAQWDPIRAFFDKCRPRAPSVYSGRIGIRLHRTGHPLTLELFGPELPEEPLPPMLHLQMDRGELTRSWDDLEVAYDVPWAKEEDFHAYRDDVMKFYHEEDALEPAAEAVLESDAPTAEQLARVVVDRRPAPIEP